MRDPGRAGRRARELYQAAIERSGYPLDPHGRRVRVTTAPAEGGELSPEAAARFAADQLVVLVENRNSDGAFLCRVIEELDHVLSRWGRCHAPTCPVRIDSVGGKGEMIKEVQRLGACSPRPRFIVVVDSDRCGPTDSKSREAHELEKACSKSGFPCWVLAKREAENYLPFELLEERPRADSVYLRRAEIWNGLTEEQKDFFDMKDGLSADPRDPEEKLFAGLDETRRQQLSKGFGDKIGECWNQREARITGALRARGGGDLERGLTLIRQEV